MEGRPGRGWWWIAALLGGCQPYSGAMGTSGANTLGVPDDTGEPTTEGTSEPTTDAPGSTSVDTGSDPSGPDVSTGGPVDDSSTGEPSPTTGGSGVVLTISDGPVYDFGDVMAGGQASHVFTVTNEGDADALGLSGAVGAPFALPGGFPGGGDCGGSLGAGQSCTVEVSFTPAEIGRHASTLAVSHDGGPDATCDVEGGATGQTANLLVNGGGEDGGNPPPGWSATQGAWIAGAVEVSPAAGLGFIYSDIGPNNVDFVLRQDVDVSAWAFTIDQGALQVSFSGQARGWWNGGGDEHRIRVHYLDAGGGTRQVWTTDYQSATEWQQHDDSRVAPVGTRTVRVELNCRKENGSWCNAYFDALELRASYP